jgi:hypothetical protein
MNSSLNWALRQTARKLCIDVRDVERIYRSYWKFVKEHIASIPLRELSEEEFNATDTNFNVPYIGKLYVEYDKIMKYNNQLKYIQNVKVKKSNPDRKPGSGD